MNGSEVIGFLILVIGISVILRIRNIILRHREEARERHQEIVFLLNDIARKLDALNFNKHDGPTQ